MYTLITKEDTIRIPAEYIRRGRKLEEHIDELAHQAFEGRFDEDENYILLTFDHETMGKGKIIHGPRTALRNQQQPALNDLAKFTHISWPTVGQQSFFRLTSKT